MNKLIYYTFLILFLFPFSAFSGGEDRGGGNAIFFPDGKVRCLDLVEPSQLPKSPVSQTEIDKIWSDKNNRYIKNPGAIDDHFFDILKKAEFQDKTKSMKNVINLFEKFPTAVFLGQIRVGKLDEFKSSSVDISYQQPIAAYEIGYVYISNRIFDRMSEEDKNCIRIHEWFRQINFLDILEENLTTEEIETLTRWFLSKSRASDNIASLLKKLSMTKVKKDIRCIDGTYKSVTDLILSMGEIYKHFIEESKSMSYEQWTSSREDEKPVRELAKEFDLNLDRSIIIHYLMKMNSFIFHQHTIQDRLNQNLGPCEFYDANGFHGTFDLFLAAKPIIYTDPQCTAKKQ